MRTLLLTGSPCHVARAGFSATHATMVSSVPLLIRVCWGTLVAAEMLAGTTGIGFIENVARTVSDYELIWVTILIMGLLGLMFDLIMRWAISRLIPWRGKG